MVTVAIEGENQITVIPDETATQPGSPGIGERQSTIQHGSYQSRALSSIYCYNNLYSFYLPDRIVFGFPDGPGFLQGHQLEVLKVIQTLQICAWSDYRRFRTLGAVSPVGICCLHFQVESDSSRQKSTWFYLLMGCFWNAFISSMF